MDLPVVALLERRMIMHLVRGGECSNEGRPLTSGRSKARVSGQGHLPNAKAR